MPFVPADFDVPQTLEAAGFRLRMLTVNDVVKDYDAVMSNVDHCKTIWPGLGWPEGLTQVAFPGRGIAWEAWKAIPLERR